MAKPQLITREQLDQAEALLRTGDYSIADVKRRVGSSSSKIDRLAHALGFKREVRSKAEIAAEKEKVLTLLGQGLEPEDITRKHGISRQRIRYHAGIKSREAKGAQYTPEQLERIVLQLNASMSLRKTAESLGISPTCVYNAELRAGVKRDKSKAAGKNEARRQQCLDTKHLSVSEAARQMGCSRATVNYYREQLGLPKEDATAEALHDEKARLTAALALVAAGESMYSATQKTGCKRSKLRDIVQATGGTVKVAGSKTRKTQVQAVKFQTAVQLMEDPLADVNEIEAKTGLSKSTIYRLSRRVKGASRLEAKSAARVELLRKMRAENPKLNKNQACDITGWDRNTVAKYWEAV